MNDKENKKNSNTNFLAFNGVLGYGRFLPEHPVQYM